MKPSAFLMSGQTLRQVSNTLRSTLVRLSFSLKNTAAGYILAVCNIEYRFWLGTIMWALKKRWWILVNKMPVYRALSEWQRAYWELDDEYNRKCDEYRLLYGKYMDLRDEVKYWEQRHSKVLYFIEKNWIEKAVEGESK